MKNSFLVPGKLYQCKKQNYRMFNLDDHYIDLDYDDLVLYVGYGTGIKDYETEFFKFLHKGLMIFDLAGYEDVFHYSFKVVDS